MTAPALRRFSPRDLAEPIVQAPLAGGPSTPALAAAVTNAGGLGFLAAGYKTAEAVAADVAAVRAATDGPFGLNLFVPSGTPADPAAIERYAGRLQAEAERQGAALGEPRHEDDGWHEKLALARSTRPVVVSFTFGCPAPAEIAGLHDAGVAVWVTVTSPAEARVADAAGADALVVQGIEAGGHRGSFADDDPPQLGLLALLQLVAAAVERRRQPDASAGTGPVETTAQSSVGAGPAALPSDGARPATSLPLIAAGGLMDGRAVAAVLAAGAQAAQLGTAFLRTPEAGTSAPHRAALASGGGDGETALTRAFSGRTARGIVNRFLREHDAAAPRAYPEVHHLTAPLRAAARARGDADAINLWAGQAYALAEEIPAAELTRRLGADARAVLRDAASRAGA